MVRHIKNLLQEITSSENKDWKQYLLSNWKSIIGDLHEHVSLQKVYQDGILLGVYDSCWLQELYLLTPLLLSKINQTLDAPHIKRIHFKQIQKKTKVAELKPQNQPKTSLPIIPLSQKEEQALKKVTDTSLRELLQSFRTHCQKNSGN